MHLVNPPVKRIDLHFPLGLEVTARNSKGVTIKDALDAIHKQFKKKVRIHRSIASLFPSSILIRCLPSPSLSHDSHHPGGRRTGQALPRWLRVGQGGVLDTPHRPPNQHKHNPKRAQQQEVQEEEQG